MSLITNIKGLEAEFMMASWNLGEAIKSKSKELNLFRLLENPIHKDFSIPNSIRPINGSDLSDTLLIIVAIEQESILSLVTLLEAGADPWAMSKSGRWCEWDVPKNVKGPYKKEIMSAMDCLDAISIFQEEGNESGIPPKPYEVSPLYANMIHDLKMEQLREEQSKNASPTKNPSTQTLSRPNHVQVIDLDASELPEYDDVEM